MLQLYEYRVESRGRSSWEFQFLEGVTDHLQQMLSDPHIDDMARQGWELWQVNTLSDQSINGVILIFRRPKA